MTRSIGILMNDEEMRDGLLDAWRQLGNAEPGRVITLLERLARHQEATPEDLWQYGLWGIRDAAKLPDLRTRLIILLQTLSPALFERTDVSSAVSDILEVMAAGQPSPSDDEDFWRLFDRTALAIQLDRSNAEIANRDWVSLAINRSMGKLTTAFFSALFAHKLKVGAGLPVELRPRLDALVKPGTPLHRPARVIAASRLSYLFAVDPEWTQATLIPCFDWTADDEDALAVWQGYAWQPRINRKLWSALKPYFLPMFSPERLQRLGEMGRNLAQMLMLVGIEFGLEELPRDDVRKAIRGMSDEMRTDCVSWIVSFLESSKEQAPADGEAQAHRPATHDADMLWTQKVAPWLGRVWPPEPALRSPSAADQFALVAIATNACFPDAVTAVTPYLVPTNAYFVYHQLARSTHPEHHSVATLELIDSVTEPNAPRFGNQLAQILERVGNADPSVAQTATFRTWNERVRARR